MGYDNNEKNINGIDLSILLGDFGRFARRSWLAAIVLVVLFSGLFILRAKLNYHPMYQASATFTVYVADPLQSEIRGYNMGTAEQMAKTFPYILTSGALKDMVKRDLDIPALPPVTASVMSNTNVFTLTVTDPDPRQAHDVLNCVMEHYPDVAEFVVGPTVMNLLDESGIPTEPFNSVSFTSGIKKGAVLGLALWLLLNLFLTMTRSTVHNEQELKRILNIRCLGAVPMVKLSRRGGQKYSTTLKHSGGRMDFFESIRLLRVRIEKELQQRQKNTLLISSATPDEGKTTIAIHLAASLAAKGKRVLLVDCDLRNPSVAEKMDCLNQNGLVDFLAGKIKAEEIVRSTDTENLYITPAGGPVGNAAELLARKETRAFINEAQKNFDYLILDTAPSAMLTDASEIAGAADAAVMVIRQNYAPRRQIVEGAQLLADSGVPLIGCVINYARGRTMSGSGYYGHYRTDVPNRT